MWSEEKINSHIGERCERMELIAFDRAEQTPRCVRYYYVGKCDCGNIKKHIRWDKFHNGEIKSCGCLQKEKASQIMNQYNKEHPCHNPPSQLGVTWSEEKINSHIGERFGKLVIEKFDRIEKRINEGGNDYYYICRCDCGNTRIVRYRDFNKSKNPVRNCTGCYIPKKPDRDYLSVILYQVWAGIMNKFKSPNNFEYPIFTARKTKVCDEWKNPNNFIEWCINNGFEQNSYVSIDDYSKDFSPSNCVIFKSDEEYYSWWASQNYATYTEVYQFDGEDHFVYHTFPISIWCEMKNVKPKIMYDRLNNLRKNGRHVNDVFVEDRQHYLSHSITDKYRMKLAKNRLVIIPGYESFERKDMYRFSFHD